MMLRSASPLPPSASNEPLLRIRQVMDHHRRMASLMSELQWPVLVTSLPNIRYLTGFTGSSAFLYVTPDAATFLTDGRYGEVAANLVDTLPSTSLSVYRQGLYDRLAELFGQADAVQLEAADVSWQVKRALAQRFDGRLEASTGMVEKLRLRKDQGEVEALRSAAAAGDYAFSVLSEIVQQAPTEAAVGESLIAAMGGERGGDRAAWPPIVAMGSNAARPHHRAGSEPIGDGLLLVDYGCVVDGYHSDMTRTVWLSGEPDSEAARIYEAVLEANEAGIAAVRPGAAAGAVDRAARDVLASHHLEEHFLHSTGHGVGLEIHEAPSVRTGSEQILEPGNVVTVEPGAYIPGQVGVRIEDMVLVTDEGREVLTHAPKELRQQ